ncbi:MAG: dipeptidase PepE [Pseudomonadota bacterium]
MNLLLLSCGSLHGGSFLEYAREWLEEILPEKGSTLFIPYAEYSLDTYLAEANEALEKFNRSCISPHKSSDPIGALDECNAILTGGGNCFRLLEKLHRTGLSSAIIERVRNGMPYVGASAGSNIACPTMSTTNDMPIVWPKTLEALGLVNFQINAHYLDPDPNSTHMGETRETRISEFHEENETPVVGLREGSAIRVIDKKVLILGTQTARLFKRGEAAIELDPEQDISEYLVT